MIISIDEITNEFIIARRTKQSYHLTVPKGREGNLEQVGG